MRPALRIALGVIGLVLLVALAQSLFRGKTVAVDGGAPSIAPARESSEPALAPGTLERTAATHHALEPDAGPPDPAPAALQPQLLIRVHFDDGSAVGGGEVRLADGNFDSYIATSVTLTADGTYSGPIVQRADFITWRANDEEQWFGFAPGRRLLDPPLEVVRGDRTLDIEVARGRVITGVVVDTRSGLPVDGARVSANRWRWFDSGLANDTGADGRFVIAGIDDTSLPSGGPAVLEVAHPRYLDRAEPIVAPADGERLDLRLELEPGLLVSGTLVDEHGAPVASAHFSLTVGSGSPRAPAPYVAVAGTTSDADGRFAFSVVTPGPVIEVCYGSYSVPEQTHVEEVQGRAAIELHLQAASGNQTEIRALDPDGERIPDFTWYMRSAEGAWLRSDRQQGQWCCLRTGDAVTVVVLAQQDQPARLLRGERTFVSAPTLDGIDVATEAVTLDDLPPEVLRASAFNVLDRQWSATYDIELIDPDGSPFRGQVRFDWLIGGYLTQSIESGHFLLSLPPGHQVHRLTAAGYAPVVLDLTGLEHTVTPYRIQLRR